jgi:hypothetical protein
MGRIAIVAGAALLLAAPAASGTAERHSIDLVSGSLDGHAVLGSTLPQVVAGLGRPDFEVGGGQPLRRIGWGTPGNFTRELIFRRAGGTLRAQTLVVERGTVIDPKAGNLLRPSGQLQSVVRTRYGNAFELVRPLACHGTQCIGEFASTSSSSTSPSARRRDAERS